MSNMSCVYVYICGSIYIYTHNYNRERERGRERLELRSVQWILLYTATEVHRIDSIMSQLGVLGKSRCSQLFSAQDLINDKNPEKFWTTDHSGSLTTNNKS